MTGEINKGDAVIFEQYDGQPLLNGQIVVFNKDNKKIIHRIIDIQTLKGEEVYYTKGDANQQKDQDYITADDVIGIVKLRVIKIGWPTIWLSEIIKN